MFKYFWLLLFVVAASFTLKAEFYRPDHSEFSDFVFRIYYTICLLLAIPLVWSWVVFYRERKKIAALSPVIVTLLFLALAGIITIQRNKKQRVPVFLTAGFETFQLQLRTDSTYRIRELGEFNVTSHYGTFKFSGDTIFLDRSHRLSLNVSERLLIGKENPGATDNSRVFIYQLDRNGNVLDNEKKLPVRDEN